MVTTLILTDTERKLAGMVDQDPDIPPFDLPPWGAPGAPPPPADHRPDAVRLLTQDPPPGRWLGLVIGEGEASDGSAAGAAGTAVRAALDRLEDRARTLGADLVGGIRIELTGAADGVMVAVAYGTAVALSEGRGEARGSSRR